MKITLQLLIALVLFFSISLLFFQTNLSAATKSLQIDVYTPNSNTRDKTDNPKNAATEAKETILDSGSPAQTNLAPCLEKNVKYNDPSQYLYQARQYFEISPGIRIGGQTIGYPNNPFNDPGYREVARTVPTANYVTEGAIDDSEWLLSDAGKKVFNDLIDSTLPPNQNAGYKLIYQNSYVRGGTLANFINPLEIHINDYNGLPVIDMLYSPYKFARFRKGTFPRGVAEAMWDGQRSIQDYVAVYPNLFGSETSSLKDFDWSKVYLLGFSCPDADFYNVVIFISPLVYLYPTATTSVQVNIASVTRSSLLKDRGGSWQVTASPGGQLSYQNKSYPYIPYEFLRKDFRRPTNGVVVNKDNLIAYLKNNLWKSLGLTDIEIEDYWQDIGWRIPQSNYYFVSLIDRPEIDRVLPMEVTPKPDTVIRNMTYILPIDKPFIPMPLPEIKAPTRSGFTVLENGGFIDGF